MRPTLTIRTEPPALHPALVAVHRAAYRCTSCWYGAVLACPTTSACPMCRSVDWLADARMRIAAAAGDLT